MAYPEAASSRHSSSFLPVFPLELWDIIIGYLDDGGTPQHLGRLSQACPALQAVIEPRLYQHVRLRSLRGGYRLARTLESRPDLRPLIREIRHKKDSGFESNDKLVRKFYRMFANLPNLEQVFMRTTLDELVNAFNRVRRPVEELGIIQETLRWSLGLTDLVLLGDDDPDTSKDPEFTEDDFQIFGNYMLQSPKGLPALRVCHIGTKCDMTEIDAKFRAPVIRSTIFQHPGLQKICITGCQLMPEGGYVPPHSTALEDLTILNCWVGPNSLGEILSWPKALKRFTIRTSQPHSHNAREMEEWYDGDFIEMGAAAQYDSLEVVDYDVYWGIDETDFYSLHKLKHLTTTLSSLAGRECHELDIEDVTTLPPSLESLTLRLDEHKAWANSVIYELVKGKKLPNLKRFTVEVPENMSELPSINTSKTNPPCQQICQQGDLWQEKFKALAVDLSMTPVSYPTKMPEFNLCSCERLEFYHRLPKHPHAEYRSPWEDEDDNWNNWDDMDEDVDLDGQGLDDTIDQFENDGDDGFSD
ncbi:unnamed protein product [Penicillium olsonii]|nr:unnamed protein product [Penicillium olsonii]